MVFGHFVVHLLLTIVDQSETFYGVKKELVNSEPSACVDNDFYNFFQNLVLVDTNSIFLQPIKNNFCNRKLEAPRTNGINKNLNSIIPLVDISPCYNMADDLKQPPIASSRLLQHPCRRSPLTN